MKSLDAQPVALLEIAPAVVHAKRYVSRWRRWFTQDVAPQNYFSTPWAIWRTHENWWLDHFGHLLVFLTKDSQLYSEGKVPINLIKALNLLKSDPLNMACTIKLSLLGQPLFTIANIHGSFTKDHWEILRQW